MSLLQLLPCGVSEREKLEQDAESRILFTYRKGFKAIGEFKDVLRMFSSQSSMMFLFLPLVCQHCWLLTLTMMSIQPINKEVAAECLA